MQHKVCTNCKREFPLTAEFFHRHGDGFQPACKTCRNAKQRAVNDTPKMKEFVRERNRKPESIEYRSRYYKADKVVNKQRQYRSENQEKIHAWKSVRRAIKAGELLHPCELDCACKGEMCAGQAMDYHHPDYSKPLEVIPVCRSCHKLIHRGVYK